MQSANGGRDPDWGFYATSLEPLSPDLGLSFAFIWPLLAIRAYAPEPFSAQSVDPLQRATLRLLAAGCRPDDSIAHLLSVSSQVLVAVLDRCRSDALVDARGALTQLAREQLDGQAPEDLSSRRGVEGWLLLDALHGDLLPCFLPVGSLEDGKRASAEQVKELPKDPRLVTRPSLRSVVSALAQGQRLLSWNEQEQEAPSPPGALRELDWSEIQEDRERPSGESQPPAWAEILPAPDVPRPLLGFLDLRRDAVGSWSLRLPLYPSLDWLFQKRLEALCERNPEVRTWRDSCLDEGRSRLWAEQLACPVPEGSPLPLLEGRAELTGVVQELKAAYRAEDRMHGDPGEYYATACLSYGKALEALFRVIVPTLPGAAGIAGWLSGADLWARLERMAGEMGVPLPNHLGSDRSAARMKAAAKYGPGSSRDAAVFLLGYARHRPGSPVAEALKHNPRMLRQIDRVAARRNAVAHPGNPLPLDPVQAVSFQRLNVHQVLAALVPLLFP